ncbi:hypothetical protein HY450_01715 [Candidatus Pacearchaeota archaeon]|nr:hypothetical protein [Candidatus Pacearchaeota archaeon]
MSLIDLAGFACLGTGIYVGYSHASGGDASLIAPAITTGIETLVARNKVNLSRSISAKVARNKVNPSGILSAEQPGKTVMTIIGGGVGAFLNIFGYAVGYGIGYAINR